jgi:hypothetical protein
MEENMASIKERIKISISNLSDELFLRESKSIEHWRQRKALEDTGSFVEENLPMVMSYPSRYALYDHITSLIRGQKGLICEFGVAGGRSINYLAKILPGYVIYGFDSFEGLPEDWRDGHPRGTFKQCALPKVAPNVKLIKGFFDKSLPGFLAEHNEPALFLHIGCGLYSSTKTIFDLMCTHIQAGTIICFDEFFNYPGWRAGEFKAFMEFTKKEKVHYEYIGYNRLGTQLAVRILS